MISAFSKKKINIQISLNKAEYNKDLSQLKRLSTLLYTKFLVGVAMRAGPV